MIELDPAFDVEFAPIKQVFLVRDFQFNFWMLYLKYILVFYVCSPDVSAGRSFLIFFYFYAVVGFSFVIFSVRSMNS